MKIQEKLSNENGHWYIAEIIEKCEPVERNEKQDLRRVTTWGNFHLIKAKSPKEAFEKAEKLGKESEYKFTNVDKPEMEWTFIGIGELIPIYDEFIEDGTELMWTDYGFISDRRTKRMVRSKENILNRIKPKLKLPKHGK
ncbi:DUF4288 domain-containing protein [uncultured Psychroserpens sp.]|uniref:DUF4288 domain-containing protein n=1 Tax=uncultured Psychroserpens sp. TaxID=255436 RepID=UPI00263583C0|nr:DUF4288 domain-containing protein [uncultured Psychroserpens sp.]